jgi:hypothetical protein
LIHILFGVCTQKNNILCTLFFLKHLRKNVKCFQKIIDSNLNIILLMIIYIYTYRVSQEERSVFCEAIVSVILSKKCIYVCLCVCVCVCVLFRTVSEILVELFYCTVPKLLITKRFYLLPIIKGIYCSSDNVGTVHLL